MKKIVMVVTTLALLLTGCHTNEEYNALAQEKATLFKQLDAANKKIQDFEGGEMAIANRIARRKAQITDEEQRLEITTACTTLPINICPVVMRMLNVDAYLNQGYRPTFTWRSWLIYIFGIAIWGVTLYLMFLGGAQAYRIAREPRNSDVVAGRETINEAAKQRTLMLGGFMTEKADLHKRLGELKHQIENATKKLFDLNMKIDDRSKHLENLDLQIEQRQVKLDELDNAINEKRNLFGE